MQQSIDNIELVTSRFNESLDWLDKEPYNKYHITIYNKGFNENFTPLKIYTFSHSIRPFPLRG
jgi:hypothetical protein